MAFATFAELAALLGTTPDPIHAEAVLEAATTFLRSEIGAHIYPPVTATFDDKVACGEQWIHLPQRPVVSVASVDVNGVAIDPSRWDLVDGCLFVDSPVRSARRFATVAVTFTYGFTTVPDDIREHCLVVAAQMLAELEFSGSLTSAGIQSRSESIDDHDESVSYETGPGANSTVELPRKVAERLRARYGQGSITTMAAR